MTWAELRDTCRRQSDYIITLLITNEVSLMLTWILAKTRVTPNQVTCASLLCGLGCSACYAFGSFFSGSLLLFSSHVLDCTDGNLARATSRFSTIGKWLDMAGDRIAEAMIFTGIAFYFIRAGESPYWMVICFVDAMLLSAYYYMVDIALTMGLTRSVQNIGGMQFKGVRVKWGLLEPVLYGFIILSSLGLVKLQLALILPTVLTGMAYQLFKMLTTAAKPV